MTSLNFQFDSIRQSATVAMADRILALKAGGQKIIGLQLGDPDFATPPAVMEVALQAMRDGLTQCLLAWQCGPGWTRLLKSSSATKAFLTIQRPRSL